MVILLYFVSSTLPCNYHLSHKGFWGEAILPRLTQQINSAFWLSTKRKKSTFNICYTCPSSLNCGIHEFLNRLCILLSKNTSKSKQPHKAPITASTFLLCNTSSTAFVSRLENIWWVCNCNQHRLNGNKFGKLVNSITDLFKMCNYWHPIPQSQVEIFWK